MMDIRRYRCMDEINFPREYWDIPIKDMTITVKTDKMSACVCGHKPTEYHLGYGRTPYIFKCKCGKQLYDAKCRVTGGEHNFIDYWNSRLAGMTKEGILEEKLDGDGIAKRNKEEWGDTLTFYWHADHGDHLEYTP